MLVKWLDGCGGEISWKAVVSALIKPTVGFKSLAEKIVMEEEVFLDGKYDLHYKKQQQKKCCLQSRQRDRFVQATSPGTGILHRFRLVPAPGHLENFSKIEKEKKSNAGIKPESTHSIARSTNQWATVATLQNAL